MSDTTRLLPAPTPRRPESYLTHARGDASAVAIASLHAMGSGTLADFQALSTADAVNREAEAEPRTPAAGVRAPCTPRPAGCAPPSAT